PSLVLESQEILKRFQFSVHIGIQKKWVLALAKEGLRLEELTSDSEGKQTEKVQASFCQLKFEHNQATVFWDPGLVTDPCELTALAEAASCPYSAGAVGWLESGGSSALVNGRVYLDFRELLDPDIPLKSRLPVFFCFEVLKRSSPSSMGCDPLVGDQSASESDSPRGARPDVQGAVWTQAPPAEEELSTPVQISPGSFAGLSHWICSDKTEEDFSGDRSASEDLTSHCDPPKTTVLFTLEYKATASSPDSAGTVKWRSHRDLGKKGTTEGSPGKAGQHFIKGLYHLLKVIFSVDFLYDFCIGAAQSNRC
ncbi:hypothetical protein STEG23_011566, partial [Scotinomys teguina]